MRILVVGEGVHDVGIRKYWSPQKKNYQSLPGWLQIILQRLAHDTEIEIDTLTRADLTFTVRDRKTLQPLPKGHGAKAALARYRAQLGEYDAVVFMADLDRESAADWKQHHKWVLEGFEKIPDGPPAVVCLPKHTSESWMLSDSNAWASMGLSDLTMLPKKPEEQWGEEKDPKSSHPKQIFGRAKDSCQSHLDDREFRVQIVEKSDINIIDKKCPLSFRKFKEECASANIAK